MSDFSTRQIASAERYANALFQLAKEAKEGCPVEPIGDDGA